MSQQVVLMTAEELVAMPENGMDRELIRGELRERPMTTRNQYHAGAEATLAMLLGMWLLQKPRPRGKVYSGEVGCMLRRDPDTTVGIDVAYFTATTLQQQTGTTTLIEGPPLLAVEILSPSDKQEEIDEKIEEYLTAGVALVWIVNTRFRHVTAYRPNAKIELFDASQELTAEPELPGFKVPVSVIFE